MMDSPEATRQTQGRIVYVVEDDDEIGRRVCATLDEHGFRSEHFLTGANFLHVLKRRPPAVAVIDLGLPDLDGLQLIRHVQSVSDSAILVLTGRHSVNDRIVGLELGADDYMIKPFEPREVRPVRRLDIRGELQPPDRPGRPRGRAVGRRGPPPCNSAEATQSYPRSRRAAQRWRP
jgi:two-component system OmpR family response regulator